MIIGIYKIENLINGKKYIGQSIDIQRRFEEHKRDKDNCRIHQAIRKYGINNFSFEIIEECSPSMLDEREKYWIKYYDSFNNGYNATHGGNQDILPAIKACQKTVYQYDFNLHLINIYSGVREASRQTGIHPSSIGECCRHILGQAGGYIFCYEGDIPIKPRLHKKKVIQYTLKDEPIQEFNSIQEASIATNSNRNAISMVCRGKRLTANGFKWRYADE